MNTIDVSTAIASIAVSLGGSTVILFALSKWLGSVWVGRIIEAEKARHSIAATDRARKLEALMAHYERQIEEFYGPLFNMVHQVFVANHIQWELLNAHDKEGPQGAAPKHTETIHEYYQSTYFLPFHDEIRKIMRSKLYLIEGSDLPESFYRYLKHAAQERDQRALWQGHGIDTSFLQGEPFPSDFYDDIKAGFETAMKNHEYCLAGLKA